MARKFLAALFISISFRLCPAEVLVAKLYGVVNPPMAEYVISSIEIAESKGWPVLLLINTPGGLDVSMRKIVEKMLNSSVPVITFVYPPGARAASAGLFILVAGHVAAMAPGTNTGAAHPVSLGVKMSKTMREKITNDAVAFIKAVAKRRRHYSRVLVQMVRKSKSLTADEAKKYGIVDYTAESIPDLLAKLEKKPVKAGDQVFRIAADEKLVFREMPFKEKFFYFICHPNVAYIMAVLGFYGLLFELSNPGLILPGVVGVIFLILSFYALHVLPVNYAGLALIVFAFVLFALEVKLATHGLLGVGGFVSFLLGSFMLFSDVGEALKPSSSLLISVSIITALFFLLILSLGVKALRKKPVSGKEGLIGERGVAKTRITPEGGWVFVHGERWRAVSDDVIEEGDEIEVVDVINLKLKVKKAGGKK